MGRKGLVLVCLLVVAALSGCGRPIKSFVEETMGVGYVQRVAILSLENHTDEPFAASRVEDVLATSILSNRFFQVVEKGDLRRFLGGELAGAKATTLDNATAKRMARELGVDAYIAGSVDEYATVSNGPYSYPVVAATFRMVDAKTGDIIWQASGSESGYSTWKRLFGFASEDANEITFKLVTRMMKTVR